MPNETPPPFTEDVAIRIRALTPVQYREMVAVVERIGSQGEAVNWHDVDWHAVLDAIEAGVKDDLGFAPGEIDRMRFALWVAKLTKAEQDRVHAHLKGLKQRSQPTFTLDELCRATKITTPMPSMSDDEVFEQWYDRHARHGVPSALFNSWQEGGA